MSNDLLRPTIAELIGTFTLVFVGGAAVASGQGVVAAALAHGLILVGIIFVYGHLSGAHVNPAITAGLLVGRQITLKRAISYWIAQFIGAIAAAVLLNVIIPDGAKLAQTTGSLTASSVWSAALFEAMMTFFFVSAVYLGSRLWQGRQSGCARHRSDPGRQHPGRWNLYRRVPQSGAYPRTGIDCGRFQLLHPLYDRHFRRRDCCWSAAHAGFVR